MSGSDIDRIMDGMARQTRQLHPQERLTVILEARQWEQVINLLHDVMAPLRVTAPLVQAISQQCMRPRTAELHALHPADEEAS